jgi:hypothetical protein
MKFTLCNHEVQIDREDFETFLSHVWFVHHTRNNTYLRTKINGHYVKLHRLLLGVTDKAVKVDHRDGNGLNNQRQNLRSCTNQQNTFNMRKTRGSSRFKGVFFCKNSRKWKAEIGLNKKKVCAGRYADELTAALAYDLAALSLHKDFARPNFSIAEAVLIHPESLKVAIAACQKRGLMPENLQLAA